MKSCARLSAPGLRTRPGAGGVLTAPLVVTLALLGFAGPARANLVINATFDSTITNDPNAAAIEGTINQAIQFYETSITTPITVAITYAEMSTGLGQSVTFGANINYSTYLAALVSHSSGDATDVSALASLAGTGPNNPVDGNAGIRVSTANLRALGFNANPPGGQADSTISVNTSITNYTGNPNNSPSFYSLLGVIEHETDEALGLGSGLDSGSTTGVIDPEDLFRYAALNGRSYNLSSATSYFSIDSGATALVNFNQVGPPGGSDYGDWANSGTARVQDAFGTPGASPSLSISSPEVIALDAIGYNITTTAAAVPEPSPWSLALLGGLVATGIRALRQRLGRPRAAA
jgi:hypothetical protein